MNYLFLDGPASGTYQDPQHLHVNIIVEFPFETFYDQGYVCFCIASTFDKFKHHTGRVLTDTSDADLVRQCRFGGSLARSLFPTCVRVNLKQDLASVPRRHALVSQPSF